MTKPVTLRHPLVAAAIAELPAKGAPWPLAERLAFFRMLSMACDVAHGSVGEIEVALKGTIDNRVAAAPPAAVKEPAKPAPAAPHVAYGSDVYVDHQGFVCSDFQIDVNGVQRPTPKRRVLPEEVSEPVYDYRGAARDRTTIIWADDTVGATPGMSFCGPG